MDYFNPLPPHGGRRKTQAAQSDSSNISIHSLRMEGDAADRPKRSAVKVFQSTPSAWRETNSLAALVRTIYISIHSLRMEGDVVAFLGKDVIRNFNPLPPHGGRPNTFAERSEMQKISIHSLRMEGDLVMLSSRHQRQPFQSTPSAWRETWIDEMS